MENDATMATTYHDLSPVELDELLSAILPDIPGHRVLRLLGRGGMSYVYLGIQDTLERQVAIKVMSPLALEDEISRQRFEKEARTIAKLQHPGIVGIHAVGRNDLGLSYYVMPHLSRGHLGQRDLRNDEIRIMAVLRALLGALDYAHAQGVVHRDVKPENVLFDHDDRPLLTDFGIAITKRDHSRMTGSGNAVGSWAYMAPEQARGEQVDGRADLYSVGVLTYEMLCGKLPFHDEDSMALALMHALDPVPRLPPEKAHWQGLIDRAMAKTAEARYATAREMLADLDRIAFEPRKPTPAAVPEHPSASRARRVSGGDRNLRPMAWIAAAAAAIVLLVVVLVFGLRSPQAPTAPAPGTSGEVAQVPEPAPTPIAAPMPESVPMGAQVAEPVPESVVLEAPDPADDPADAAGQTIEDELRASEAARLAELSPGEVHLLIATEQMRRRRLTQPRGDNALESLLAAQKLFGKKDPRLLAAGERWLTAWQPLVVAALERREDDAAKALREHAVRLEQALSLGETKAWQELQSAWIAPVHQQLRKALADKDLAALRAARTRAEHLGIAAAQLEPEYSSAIVLAKAGDPMKAGDTRMILVQLPTAKKPGLAALPTVVTRDDYAAFARASGRAAANCRIRTASMTVRKRTWQDPGIPQAGGHPVVCVSLADALAYAAWLGQRDGASYRLPAAAEWQLATGAPANAACGNGVQCQDKGTIVASSGAGTKLGVHGAVGNVREWSAGCSNCQDHPTLGLGWRDAAAARKSFETNPALGYDDVGFRLVRDIRLELVEQR